MPNENSLITDMGWALPSVMKGFLDTVKRKDPSNNGNKKRERHYSLGISRLHKEIMNRPRLADDFDFNIRMVKIIIKEKLFIPLMPEYRLVYAMGSAKRELLEANYIYGQKGTRDIPLASWHRVIASEVLGNKPIRVHTFQEAQAKDYGMINPTRLNTTRFNFGNPSFTSDPILKFVQHYGGTRDLIHFLFIVFGRRDYLGDNYDYIRKS